LKSRKIPLPPPFPKGEKEESSIADSAKALLPLKKGGREGFLGRPFQNAKVLQKIQFLYIMFPPFVKAPSIADFGLRISDFICFFFLSIRNPQSPIRN